MNITMSDDLKLEIARCIHEVNAAYCRAIGDDSAISWDESGDDHKASLVAAVEMHLENPDVAPELAHQNWMDRKIAEGWKLGEVVDREKKIHTLLVPYDKVPDEQRVKDHLCKAVVLAIAAIPVPPEAEYKEEKIIDVGRVPVKYIGKREVYTDGLYKTGLTWNKGQTHLVENDKASQLLTHKDQYVLGKLEEASNITGKESIDEIVSPENKETDDEERIQNAKDGIMAMQEVQGVKDYAFTNFGGKKLHPRIGLEKAQQQVISLIDQFGLGE